MIEKQLYRQRFSDVELAQQRAFWAPICRWLQRYVDPQGATLDLGAGYCHFINQIQSKTKIALDINDENLTIHAAPGVRCVTMPGSDLNFLPAGSLDTVFASNVYEHFPSREEVAKSFAGVYAALRKSGRFIILQPNFAVCYRQYFDFFDHRLAFTRLGMEEGLQSAGFETEKAIDRFLPYTSKSKLPRAPWMVSLYLNVPLAWQILGGQMLLVVKK